MMKMNKKRKAFTIVELVIVIAVIGILAGVMIPVFGGIITNAQISNDTQTAANLTKELIIINDGAEIKDEATLVAALAKIENMESKLSPESVNNGYHFWFDMDTQKVELKKVEEVAEINKPAAATPTANANVAPAVSAVNTTTTSGSGSMTGLRNLYPYNGYHLITSDTALTNIFSADMSSVKYGSDYENLINNIKEAADAGNFFSPIASVVLGNLEKTVIVDDSAEYYFSENTSDAYYYFTPGVTVIPSTQYVYNGSTVEVKSGETLPTPVDEVVTIPESVTMISENALNFSDAQGVTIKTQAENGNDLAGLLTPSCSNGIFTDKNDNQYIVAESTNNPETDAIYQYDANGTGAWECDLVKRVPYEEYVPYVADNGNLAVWTGSKLYILITQSGEAKLGMKSTAGDISYGTVNTWGSDNSAISVDASGTLTFDIAALASSGKYNAKITANTKNIKGVDKEVTFEVEVVRPTAASIMINGKSFQLDGEAKQLTLNYNGATTQYDVTLNGVTYTPASTVGTNEMTISTAADSKLIFNGNILSFDTAKSDNTFTVSVDGCLTTEFTVNLNDVSNAVFKHNFYNDRTVLRPHYAGEGDAVYLADLFGIKSGKTFNGATVTVYDRYDTDSSGNPWYSTLCEISKTDDDGLYATYTKTVTDWNSATITFNIDKNYADYVEGDTYLVYIEITDTAGVSVIFTVNLAEDAINVKSADFNSLSTLSSDVVLHGDASVTTGTNLNIGNYTLYGNGYKINATSYTGSTTASSSFITVSGGTVDNVYINGPIYPELEYNTYSKGYHVSGIEINGTAAVQNSYVSGFRQPICVNGGSLTLKESTLYGGSYANLQLISGNLVVTNVTTVQPEDGIADTFSKGKYVIGLGIVVEENAVNGTTSKIEIKDGYLDQYNWVSTDSTATFPVLTIDGTDIDFKLVMAALFNGIKMEFTFWGRVVEDMTRTLGFLDNYIETVEGVKYLNTGIVMISIGNNAPTTKANRTNLTVTGTSNGLGTVTAAPLSVSNIPLFSTYEIKLTSSVTITADKLMRMLEEFTVNSDGYAYYSMAASEVFSVFSSISSPIDLSLDVWSYKNTAVSLGSTGYPIEWTSGYYVNYGN